MMPPINGMQASAAATFEGNPVALDFGPSSGPGAGGGEGGVGSWSGMTYLHRMENALSSNLAFAALFSFRSPPRRNIIRSKPQYPWPKVPLPLLGAPSP